MHRHKSGAESWASHNNLKKKNKNNQSSDESNKQSSAAAPDTMCHFNIKISICSFSVNSKCHSTFCAPMFGSISWLQQGLRGVSRWRTANSRTPRSNNRLIIEANSTNWNTGPPAYATVIHLPPRTCAFTTILLWNRGLVSKRCSELVIFRLLGKTFVLQKKVKCTLQTWGQNTTFPPSIPGGNVFYCDRWKLVPVYRSKGLQQCRSPVYTHMYKHTEIHEWKQSILNSLVHVGGDLMLNRVW